MIFIISIIKLEILLFILFFAQSCSQNSRYLPESLNPFIDSLHVGNLGDSRPTINYVKISDTVIRVFISFELQDSVAQDDWRVNIEPAFSPDFHWAPHLTPTENHIIPQHIFRAPMLIAVSKQKMLTIIPDIDLIKKDYPVDWYMDMDAQKNIFTLGLSESKIDAHVIYVRKAGAVHRKGKVKFGFYILVSDDKNDIQNPWRKALSFFWEKWGSNEFRKFASEMNNIEEYSEYTYKWAFDAWKQSVWQEFEINGKKVGAPVFIVNVTQSPNYPGQVNEREFRSIWNQAWFSSLRSASGLYRYAKRKNNKELLEYALKTKELALMFPQNKGFFPGLIATEMESFEIDGKKHQRSKGWDSYYFGNSNRNPYTWDPAKAPYHILDMSMTANYMLIWYTELEQDKRLLDYAIKYADALLDIQFENGFFPGWLDMDLNPRQHLNTSPETSMSVTFLLNLFKITHIKKYRTAALRAMDVVIDSVIFTGRWEDFETYWSCSRYGSKDMVGRKFERNNMFKQNNFSIYWTAEALLNCYEITKNIKYLKPGVRNIDELLAYQAIWQPPFIYIRAIGGFGVMNADAEWNDSRQSLFAELIIRYGKLLNRQEYIERGLAALYASFEMMYCPKNQKTKEQWEKKWSFFNEKDYGFMMENYGHSGVTGSEGIGIGPFTIYDWGNGAAAEAYNRIFDHYGKDFVEHQLGGKVGD